jgi:hypothetical protein
MNRSYSFNPQAPFKAQAAANKVDGRLVMTLPYFLPKVDEKEW